MIRAPSQEESGFGLADLAPDLTPMLDILFILLVFFMLTAGAVFQSLDVTLPEDVTDTVPPLTAPKYIMLEISRDSYRVDQKEVSDFISLRDEIREQIRTKPDHELVIAGDQRISMDRFLKVLTYLQSQKIDTANILMTRGADQ
jgi:biopolymer transport protein ExbD